MSILALIIFILKAIGIFLVLLFLVLSFIIFSGIKATILVNNNSGILNYNVKITYLFGIVRYTLNNEYKKLKIFGINIDKFKFPKKSKKKKIKKNTSFYKNRKKETNLNNDENVVEKDIFDLKNKEDIVNTTKKNLENKKSNKSDKIKNVKQKVKNIKAGYYNIKDTLSKILQYPEKEKIIKLTLEFINKLLKSIKFKKLKINVEYGFQEPFQTGVFCGIISSILPFLPKKCIKELNILPNFEKQTFLLDSNIKCKTSIYKILLPIIMFISKEPIKKLIFRKGE